MNVLFVCRGEENPGIEALSAVLKARGHTTGLLFDPGFREIFLGGARLWEKLTPRRILIEAASPFEPDLIAFNILTLSYPSLRKIAEELRESLGVPQIAGGAHATISWASLLDSGCFNWVCVGEGEGALTDLVECLERGEDPREIPNIGCLREGRHHLTPPRPLIEDLDRLPFPDREPFYRAGAFGNRLCILTARGCPFQCSYCIHSVLHLLSPDGPAYRVRSVDSVVRELLEARRFGYGTVRIWDDLFGVDPNWVTQFCREYGRSIALPFSCTMHPKSVRPEVIGELKGAGCTRIAVGIQSGSESIKRDVLGRTETNDVVLEAAKTIKSAGVDLLLENMFALPGEGREEIDQTAELNLAAGPKNVSTFIFFPFPGYPLTKQAIDEGLLTKETEERIARGEADLSSWHRESLLDHPHADYAYRAKVFLPLFKGMPKLFRWLMQRSLGRPHRLWFICSLLFIDSAEFWQKLRDYVRIGIRHRRTGNAA